MSQDEDRNFSASLEFPTTQYIIHGSTMALTLFEKVVEWSAYQSVDTSIWGQLTASFTEASLFSPQ